MLSLIRFYDRALSDAQCQASYERGFEWNPVLNQPLSTANPVSTALREVHRQRMLHQPRWPRGVAPPLQFSTHNAQVCNPRGNRPWRSFANQPGWVATECGGGGDCFFHSVGVALRMDMLDVRHMAARSVTADNVDRLLAYYNDVYRDGAWNREIIMGIPTVEGRVDALRAIIVQPGGVYLGDDTTMRMLAQSQQVGFIVFDLNGHLHRQVFVNRETRRLVALLYVPGHWQLVGQEIPNDPFHRIQTTWAPFDVLPLFLAQRLADIDVDLVVDFSTWAPCLELEVKRAAVVERKETTAVVVQQGGPEEQPPADDVSTTTL